MMPLFRRVEFIHIRLIKKSYKIEDANEALVDSSVQIQGSTEYHRPQPIRHSWMFLRESSKYNLGVMERDPRVSCASISLYLRAMYRLGREVLRVVGVESTSCRNLSESDEDERSRQLKR